MESNNYYLSIEQKMMKEFDKMFKGAQISLEHHFSKTIILEIKEKSKNDYINSFPQLPYIGGKSNKNTIDLIVCSVILSMINHLEQKGLSKYQIGKIIFDAFDGYFNSNPRIIRYIMGKLSSTEFFVNAIKKNNDKSLLKEHKGDFVIKNVDPNGEEFDFGYNYTECAIHKLFKKHNKEQYLQYVCLGDYALFKSFNIGFYRTQTIANGAPLCDFRFKKGAKTANGWPPEKLDEWKAID